MSYTITSSLALGTSQVSITLNAQLVDISGSNVGPAVSTGFVEMGNGNYIWTYSGFTAGFRGGVKFYNVLAPAIILAAVAINPEEIEFIDTIEGTVEGTLVSPREITINVPQVSSTNSVSITKGSSVGSNIDIKTGVR